jgi:hypothetical protein
MNLQEDHKQQRYQAELLIQRLARLSADSTWARRASGVRAAIDKALSNSDEQNFEYLGSLIESGFALIEKAAREIPVPEQILLGFQERKPK